MNGTKLSDPEEVSDATGEPDTIAEDVGVELPDIALVVAGLVKVLELLNVVPSDTVIFSTWVKVLSNDLVVWPSGTNCGTTVVNVLEKTPYDSDTELVGEGALAVLIPPLVLMTDTWVSVESKEIVLPLNDENCGTTVVSVLVYMLKEPGPEPELGNGLADVGVVATVSWLVVSAVAVVSAEVPVGPEGTGGGIGLDDAEVGEDTGGAGGGEFVGAGGTLSVGGDGVPEPAVVQGCQPELP